MRDPNFITPKRSPAATSSPGFARHTTRLTSTPVIWRKTTVPAAASTQTSLRSFSMVASGR